MSSSRREFLRDGLAAAGALALTSGCTSTDSATDVAPVGQAGSAHERGLIDAHVHVWTPDTDRYPLASGYRKESMRPPSFTPEELFAHSRPAGVDRIVLIQMSFYGFDNSYMLDAMEKHAGVFGGVAVIDEEASPRHRMKALLRRGVRGFRIRPRGRKPDAWLSGSGMRSMWDEAASSGQQMCALINPEFLGSLDRMCAEFPRTPVVIDHFARIGIDGTTPDTQIDALCRLARHENVKVKVSAYYALGQRQAPYLDLLPMIRRVFSEFGAQRLMWATDCPFQVAGGHSYLDSVDLIRKRCEFLGDDELDWILRRTAETTFF